MAATRSARFVGAALGQSPAVWVVAALALLLYAAGSRYAVLGWAAVAAFFALGQLGELLDLPACGDRAVAVHAPARDAGRAVRAALRR